MSEIRIDTLVIDPNSGANPKGEVYAVWDIFIEDGLTWVFMVNRSGYRWTSKIENLKPFVFPKNIEKSLE